VDRVVDPVRVGDREIGPGRPCWVIAEAGVNHNGDVGMALELIEVAARAGAHAVKFQTFRAEEVLSAGAEKADYQKRTTGADAGQLQMARGLELPPDAFRRLQRRCLDLGITFLSTPFDLPSRDLLVELDVPAIKVASGELTNLPFLSAIGATRRPVILSTGMATLAETARGVEAVLEGGANDIILLHCVSEYPTPPESANLRAMDTLRDRFARPVGFSDHTLGIDISLAAVALGACVLEKHFTLDRELPGPDHAASLEPDQLAALVDGVRRVEASLGDGRKVPTAVELETARVGRRSVVAARRIRAGEILDADALRLKRPGSGIPPADLARVIGRTAAHDIEADAVVAWEDLA
jgi:N-acetylneuraminate synthase/N,N'-diacetyllegionaminate synthase